MFNLCQPQWNTQILIFNTFLEDREGYQLKFNAYCKFPIGYTESRADKFKTITDAKERCNEMTNCTMFYKVQTGTHLFKICPPGSVEETSYIGTRLYVKGKKDRYAILEDVFFSVKYLYHHLITLFSRILWFHLR